MDGCQMDASMFEQILNEYSGDPDEECMEGVTWREAKKSIKIYKTFNLAVCCDTDNSEMQIDTVSTDRVSGRLKRQLSPRNEVNHNKRAKQPSTTSKKKRKRRVCKHDGCTKLRVYGDATTRVKCYCAEHKLDGHVNLSKVCKHAGCTKYPSFGKQGSRTKEFCSKHKPDDYVSVSKRGCKHAGCQKHATFGVKGTKRRIFCITHKPDDTYIDMTVKRCKHLNCELPALYGNGIGKKTKEFCEQHKPDGYINLTVRFCQHPGCKTEASYGESGTTVRLFCIQHKPVNHVVLGRELCAHEGCSKVPNFGERGSLGKYCGDHKLPEHVNVWAQRCTYDGCDIQASSFSTDDPTLLYCATHKPDKSKLIRGGCQYADCNRYACFGKPATTHATYCDEHRPADYVNVRAKLCKFPGCQVTRSYRKTESDAMEFCATHAPEGYISGTTCKCKSNGCSNRARYGANRTGKVEYCKSHAPPKYIIIHNAFCQDPSGCERRASYGLAKTTERVYCKQHAPSGYVNVSAKTCEKDGCKQIAYYGPLFGDKIHCLDHKTLNEYAKNKPKCLSQPCKNKPCCTNQNDGYPLRCEDHKLDNDKNIMEKKCSMCGLMQFILDGKTMCNDCDDFHVKKVHKAKETRIQQVLETAGFTMTHDRIPQNGCQKYRPDFVISASKNSQPTMHCVIVEVDENQHESYACECEHARMINLFQEFGGLKVAFVRYNPDTYTNNLGVRITSKTGREAKLIQTIEALLLHPPDPILSCTYLFYNGFDGQAQPFAIDYGL